ncbi:MAG TPA: TonB-dependent receptor [bacterium]|nr:TonB-dependent receptor [bacterium]
MNNIIKKQNIRSIYSKKIRGLIPLFLGGLLVLLFLVDISFAQKSASPKRNVKGYVKDAESGEALPSANVLIKGTYLGAATNTDGYFVILNVPVGICTLQVSYIGYITQEFSVKNIEGEQEQLLIEMVQTLLESEEIVVTAYRQMLEISNEVSQVTLSPYQIASLPNIGEVDIFRTLQLLPGISGVNDGSSGLYVRGGTPDQNLVLLDGMTIYHVDHFYGFFSAFNADAIKDIRVYKGGFPAEYGGRISSVVNLTGKTGDVNKFRFGAGANLLSGHTLFEVPLFNKGAWLFSARRSYTDYIQSSLYNDIYSLLTGGEEPTSRRGGIVQQREGRPGGFGGGRGNMAFGETQPDFYFYDINSKVTLTPTEKDIFALSLYNGKDKLDNSQDFGDFGFQRFGGTNDEEVNLKINNITEWGNFGMSGKWSRQWHDRYYSHISIANSKYFSNYDRSNRLETEFSRNDSLNVARGLVNASEEDNEVKDLTFRIDNELHLTNSHQLRAGVWLSKFNANYESTLNDTTKLLSRKTDALLSAFYLQDKWRLWNAFELTFGLRVTFYDPTQSKYFEPRASFKYLISDNITLKGAWGQYRQFINRITNENVLEASRDFWLLADDEFKPGFSEHRIIGLEYENRDYLFSIEGYQKDLEGLIEYSRRYNVNADYNNRFFLGTGIAEGIEFLAQKKRGKLTGWVGYTLGKVEHVFPKLNNGEPFPADHDRMHELKAVGILKRGKWNFSATWVYASGRAYTAPESQYFLELLDGSVQSYIHVSGKNTLRLSPYHRLDVSVSRRFENKRAKFDIGASVFNLYNHKNVWYKEYNLDVSPIVETDVVMLGFTPTVYFQLYLR